MVKIPNLPSEDGSTLLADTLLVSENQTGGTPLTKNVTLQDLSFAVKEIIEPLILYDLLEQQIGDVQILTTQQTGFVETVKMPTTVKVGNFIYLRCNGLAIDPIEYPKLASIYGATTPAWNGRYLRNTDNADHLGGTLEENRVQGASETLVEFAFKIVAFQTGNPVVEALPLNGSKVTGTNIAGDSLQSNSKDANGHTISMIDPLTDQPYLIDPDKGRNTASETRPQTAVEGFYVKAKVDLSI